MFKVKKDTIYIDLISRVLREKIDLF